MRHRSPFLRVALLLLAAFTFAHGTAAAQSGTDIIQRLETKYDAIDALRAEFSQTMSSAYADGAQTFSGTLTLQGERYYIEAGNQTLVTDGATTWIYNRDERQVLVNDAVEDETSFSINDFFFNFEDRYDVTSATPVQIDGQRHYRLALQPKSADSFFREVTLWVRDADTIITQLEVKDANETTMKFTLENIQLNPQVDASTFQFKAPQGAQVIDLRS